jgi:hypothetical protein
LPRKAKAVTDIKSLARQHTDKAIASLAGIMNQPKAPAAARVAAAQALLDRGWGKAVQPTDNKHDLTGRIRVELVNID